MTYGGGSCCLGRLLWLCLFVFLLMVRRFLIFLFNVGSSWGVGIEFSRNTQVLSTHRQRGWGIGGGVAAQNAKIHIWDTNATSWLAKGTQKVAVAIYATTISASCDCASVKGRDKGVRVKRKKQNKYWVTKNKQNTQLVANINFSFTKLSGSLITRSTLNMLVIFSWNFLPNKNFQ